MATPFFTAALEGNMNYLTALSIEKQAPEQMKSLGLSVNFVAALISLAPIVLSRAFRGIQPLTNEKGLELRSLLNTLMEYRDAVAPLLLPLQNATDVLTMLSRFEERNITPDVLRERIQILFHV